jgi:hypothetical protein
MDPEAQRLLKDFATHLNRTVPQPEPAEWPRLYDFIIHVTRRQAPSAEAVGHALVQTGLDWEEIEPYVIFYGRAVALLGRAQEKAVTRGAPAAKRPVTKKRAPVRRPGRR